LKVPGLVATVALASLLPCAGPCAEAAIREGEKAPLAAIPGVVDAEGRIVDLSRLTLSSNARAGDPTARATLLVFWASWCLPCIHEIPVINELQRFYGRRGLRVLGLGVREGNETLERLKQTAAKHGVTYPLLFDTQGEAQKAFDLSAVPMSALIDASGTVRWIGPALPSDAAARIEAALEPGEQRGAK
jgi:thiol-disulfide isomerase/thioredoxin